jgi:hypothetical protein
VIFASCQTGDAGVIMNLGSVSRQAVVGFDLELLDFSQRALPGPGWSCHLAGVLI